MEVEAAGFFRHRYPGLGSARYSLRATHGVEHEVLGNLLILPSEPISAVQNVTDNVLQCRLLSAHGGVDVAAGRT